jgi:hypothetical protein
MKKKRAAEDEDPARGSSPRTRQADPVRNAVEPAPLSQTPAPNPPKSTPSTSVSVSTKNGGKVTFTEKEKERERRGTELTSIYTTGNFAYLSMPTGVRGALKRGIGCYQRRNQPTSVTSYKCDIAWIWFLVTNHRCDIAWIWVPAEVSGQARIRDSHREESPHCRSYTHHCQVFRPGNHRLFCPCAAN